MHQSSPVDVVKYPVNDSLCISVLKFTCFTQEFKARVIQNGLQQRTEVIKCQVLQTEHSTGMSALAYFSCSGLYHCCTSACTLQIVCCLWTAHNMIQCAHQSVESKPPSTHASQHVAPNHTTKQLRMYHLTHHHTHLATILTQDLPQPFSRWSSDQASVCPPTDKRLLLYQASTAASHKPLKPGVCYYGGQLTHLLDHCAELFQVHTMRVGCKQLINTCMESVLDVFWQRRPSRVVKLGDGCERWLQGHARHKVRTEATWVMLLSNNTVPRAECGG